MSCKRPACLLAALVVGAGFGCSRRANPEAERFAILRFENLGADPAQDWMGRALSEIAAADLTGVAGVSVIPPAKVQSFDRALGRTVSTVPGISAERSQAVLAGANRLVYGQYEVRGGALDVQISIEDPATNRTVRVFGVRGRSSDVIAAAEEVAKQIHPGAQPYVTRSQAAVRGWVAGMEQGPASGDALAGAIAADPGFAPPYLMLARLKLAQQDREGAEGVLAQAAAHESAMPAADRARIALEAAALRGDTAGRRRALADLARATPDDASLWRAIADDANSRRQYGAAMEALRKAAALEPTDIATLNALGYAAAFAGDLGTAKQALEQYGRLRPAEANPLDSLGDVHLRLGKLQEAEQYYTQAFAKDAKFLGGGTLFKAAWAHLLTGDVAGADAVFRRYLDARKQDGDPVLDYRQAQWLWASGKRKEGIAQLAAFCRGHQTGPLLDYAARGYAQLAIWNLALGDRAAASGMADLAMPLARPATAALAVMARFLVQPPATAAEWTARAARSFPQPAQAGFRNLTLASALLFAKEFAAAVPVLRTMEQAPAQGTDDTLPVMLAWAELVSGTTEGDAARIAPNPIPSPDGSAPFTVLWFPRQFYLRGLLAEKQQNRDAAAAAYRLFLQLSGLSPLVWGEEAHAREFLSK